MANSKDQPLAFKIQNVVATYNSGVQKLDLKRVCRDLGWCQINSEIFAALIGRLKNPKTTLLTFTSSNNVCTGAKKIIHSRIACRLTAAVMQKRGYEVSMRKFEVQNIVASAYTGFPLQLENIAASFTPDASFDPEIFPGLIYRMKFPKIVFLLFREGKLVITGGKKIEDLQKAVDIFHETVLLPYRDYSGTLNHTQIQSHSGIANIVEKIVEKFGEDGDRPSAETMGEDFTDDIGDIEESLNEENINKLQQEYEEQLKRIQNEENITTKKRKNIETEDTQQKRPLKKSFEFSYKNVHK